MTLRLGLNARRAPDLTLPAMHALLGMYADGRIQPYMSARLPLDEAPAALAMVGGGKITGKVVLQT